MLKLFLLISCLLLCVEQIYTLNVDSRYQFAADLFREAALSKQNENVVLSPASVQTCLAFTYIGAEGETAKELSQGLHLGKQTRKEDVAADYREFLSSTQGADSKVHMANAIYVDHKFELQPKFVETAARDFDSKAETVNFANSQKSADKINAWVETQTNNKIQHLMDANSLDESTAAVLVNAIYFKAKWLHKFDSFLTAPLEFTSSAREKRAVPTMFRSETPLMAGDIPELDAVAVDLPYEDSNLKMLILLPNRVDGLHDLESKLSAASLYSLPQYLKKEKVDIYLPKFKIEFSLSLVDTLKKLGMSSMFDKRADLSGMLKSTLPLQISDVRHKAFIEVTEEGTEASGATYAIATVRSARRFDRTVRIDHPFVFAIHDDNAVYFKGHVVNL